MPRAEPESLDDEGLPRPAPVRDKAPRWLLRTLFAVPATAVSVRRSDGLYTVELDDGARVTARSVVVATGASYRRLDVPRLEHFERASVYYAASQAEALLCRGDPVAIVGGGNSAGQAAVFRDIRAKRAQKPTA
jgi:thioredoxin reductase